MKKPVIPACEGISLLQSTNGIPACAGMTPVFLRSSVIKTQRAAALCDWAEL
ncbi:MAG: hypothetical protein LBN95_06150 [Prevotellaceae bacterium]|nr:hypothetical protein [Prevotellaceae bacterium]